MILAHLLEEISEVVNITALFFMLKFILRAYIIQFELINSCLSIGISVVLSLKIAVFVKKGNFKVIL